jgi:fluoride ion exporter CrcB/FEX
VHELYMTLPIATAFSRRFWTLHIHGRHCGPRLQASKAKLMCGVGVVGGVATCCTWSWGLQYMSRHENK